MMHIHPAVNVSDPLPLEICANCGHPIGIHETPHIWHETAVVCSICRDQLEDQQMIFRAFGKAMPGIGAAGFRIG